MYLNFSKFSSSCNKKEQQITAEPATSNNSIKEKNAWGPGIKISNFQVDSYNQSGST